MDFYPANVPRGTILLWSGSIASIPSGWAICDGTKGTPNLKLKFVRCVGIGVNPLDTGGSVEHTHNAQGVIFDSTLNEGTKILNSAPAGNWEDWLSDDSVDISLEPSNHLPSWIGLCYIMKL